MNPHPVTPRQAVEHGLRHHRHAGHRPGDAAAEREHAHHEDQAGDQRDPAAEGIEVVLQTHHQRRARGQAPAQTEVPAHAAQDDNVVQMPDRRSAVAAALSDLKPRLEVVGGKADIEVSDSDVEQMRQIKIGTWIHIAGEDGKHHPVKLSWISPISSRLMFVNRRGVRVLVASVEELAAMKQEGNLLVREQENVFDQVLHRVMGKLKTEAN